MKSRATKDALNIIMYDLLPFVFYRIVYEDQIRYDGINIERFVLYWRVMCNVVCWSATESNQLLIMINIQRRRSFGTLGKHRSGCSYIITADIQWCVHSKVMTLFVEYEINSTTHLDFRFWLDSLIIAVYVWDCCSTDYSLLLRNCPILTTNESYSFHSTFLLRASTSITPFALSVHLCVININKAATFILLSKRLCIYFMRKRMCVWCEVFSADEYEPGGMVHKSKCWIRFRGITALCNTRCRVQSQPIISGIDLNSHTLSSCAIVVAGICVIAFALCRNIFGWIP